MSVRLLTNDEIERLRRLEARFYLPIPSVKVQPKCITCGGTGKYRWYKDDGSERSEEVVEVECDCLEQWKLYAAFTNAGIPLYFQKLRWWDMGGLDASSASMAIDFVTEKYGPFSGIGLFLYGQRGTGKSALSVLMLKHLIVRKGARGHYTTFDQLVQKYAEGWDDSENRDWFIKKVRGAEILVIDDVGRELGTKIVEPLFEEVLRHRVSSGFPTIITSNKDPEEVGKRYGGHVRELMTETMIQHHFKGESYRDDARRRKESELNLTRPIVVGL